MLPSPSVIPQALAGQARPKPLPSLQLQQLRVDSQSTALGSGISVSGSQPTSLSSRGLGGHLGPPQQCKAQELRVALGINGDNPSSVWRKEEGRWRGCGLCDFLIPGYNIFSLSETAAETFFFSGRSLVLVIDAVLKRIES